MGAIDLQNRHDPASGPPVRLFGLRLKFMLFFSLILIVTCSSLSWYFLEARRKAMTDHLEELGAILLTNTVRNERFRLAGVVLEDRVTLEQFVHSLMAIDHVMYVVIASADGRILDRQSKRLRKPASGDPSTAQPFYPDDQIAASLLQAPLTTPLVTRLALSANQTLMPPDDSSDWRLPFFARTETLYDFAMPVLRKVPSDASLPLLSDELEEKAPYILSTKHLPVVGLVRIGLTDAQAKEALLVIVRNVSILTVFIIVAGILGSLHMTSRITTPLRNLAQSARQLARGNDAPVPLEASTNDEVGELTHVFNGMTQSLYDRNRAITKNLGTIKRQVAQLTTVHQASATIANATLFDMNHLLDTVLRLIVENLGFFRMMVVLHDEDRNCASVARIIGVSPEIVERVRHLQVPVLDNGGITADLLLHGKPVLIQEVESATERFYPPLLELVRRSGIRSFVGVPLQSHGRILGYLAGDQGSHPCSQEELHILMTIAGHVAAAIDNAKAYSDLAELTQHQEERIEQRTQELSRANAQLLAHDQRRSKYVKVVSHELRTPMTAIRSFAENMLDGVTGPLTDLQRTYLARIQHNVGRLVRLADELLDWLRSDELRLENVSLGHIVTTVAGSLETVASDKQVSLAVALKEDLPTIQGDRDKLEQIFWNLIGNAIKFTPPGGRVTIEFCVSPPGFVQTCVADTGCGIDPFHLPKVFEEFSEVPSLMPASQGAQLGLCITKALVARHHGQIWAESRPQGGSRFYFTLPIAANDSGKDGHHAG